jgi:hypothetical protein
MAGLRCEKRRPVLRDRLDAHFSDTFVAKAQRLGGRSRDIDNAASQEGSAVAHDDEC